MPPKCPFDDGWIDRERGEVIDTHGAIRVARQGDIGAMQDAERAAGQLFAAYGMTDVAVHPPADVPTLEAYIDGGRAWVAEVNRETVGYALAEVVDGCGHLEQVSVDPAYGRQGLGRALIRAVIAWATAQSYPALTLSTFCEVPWNGPYYASLGFRPLGQSALTPGLRTIQRHERDLGLDPTTRQVMRMELSPPGHASK